MECRIVKADGQVGFRPHFNRLPQTYEFSSDPLACFAWKKEHWGDLEVSFVEVYPSKERLIGHVGTQDYDYSTSILVAFARPGLSDNYIYAVGNSLGTGSRRHGDVRQSISTAESVN